MSPLGVEKLLKNCFIVGFGGGTIEIIHGRNVTNIRYFGWFWVWDWGRASPICTYGRSVASQSQGICMRNSFGFQKCGDFFQLAIFPTNRLRFGFTFCILAL